MSNKDHSKWHSVLEGRYASEEMQVLFSDDKRFSTWRRLWVALAEAECRLGLPVTEEQIAEMRAHITDINYDDVERLEHKLRHDVMAHIEAYGLQCPKAAGIIHMGATSCFVTDNADIVIMKEALILIQRKLLEVIKNLAAFAEEYKALPTLGYTHGQPAAPTTVGKRAALWLQNFMENLNDLDFLLTEKMRLLGCRGATGTSDTFMELLEGNEQDVCDLDGMIALAMGFSANAVWMISGQTYPRSFDVQVMHLLENLAVSATKMFTDLRLAQSFKEMEEPFGKNQVGSSAMAYKRNPMRAERGCSLARYVQHESRNACDTANAQWFERTLDDSANRRMSISEAFLATDALLIVAADVTSGLVVYPAVIQKRLEAELPFMVTEKILMRAVKNGGDRQKLHERIRVHSMAATENVKMRGGENNLIELILEDPEFSMLDPADVADMLNPENLTGRCVGQVTNYLQAEVKPTLEFYADFMAKSTPTTELKV